MKEETKTAAYFGVIEGHVLAPIRDTDLSTSCVASLLLLFAAVDGLGKLLHPHATARVAERFKFFLREYMGGKYNTHCCELYNLRCSLSHNALSLSAFMSRTMMGEQHHLEHDTPVGTIFVSTNVFLRDFSTALDRVSRLLASDPAMMHRAEDRLQWIDDEQHPCWGPCSTPPGPIRFVTERETDAEQAPGALR